MGHMRWGRLLYQVEILFIFVICLWVHGYAFAANTALYESEETYGVETLEDDAVQFYLSPQMGTSVLVGNNVIDSRSKAAFMMRGGVLLSEQFLLTVGAGRRTTGLFNPRNEAAFVSSQSQLQSAFLSPDSDLLDFRQTSIDVGGAFFLLGRDQRIRPFITGSLGMRFGELTYSSQYSGSSNSSAGDATYKIRQFFGAGGIGTEVAFSKSVALTTQFLFEGILGARGSDNESGASKFDPLMDSVARSLAKGMAYSFSLGVSVYL